MKHRPTTRFGPNRGRWEAIAPGQRLTLTEAAEAIGITRESLYRNYAGSRPLRKLPAGYRFVSISPKVMLLARDLDTPHHTTRQDITKEG